MDLKGKKTTCCRAFMKAYTPYEEAGEMAYSYPEQMEKILDFLNANGQLNVADATVECLYREFSEDRYCAGWMIVDENLLAEFAEWLSNYDV